MAALDSGEEKLPLEGEGKMLGILACDDADGNRVALKAFSGQVGGPWIIPGAKYRRAQDAPILGLKPDIIPFTTTAAGDTFPAA